MQTKQDFEPLYSAAKALADYYEKSLMVGPGKSPQKETFLWVALRKAIAYAEDTNARAESTITDDLSQPCNYCGGMRGEHRDDCKRLGVVSQPEYVPTNKQLT